MQRANQRVQCTIIILLQIGREPTRESSTQLSFCYREQVQRANQRVQYTIIILLQIGREPTRESSAQLSFCYRQVESQLESPVHNYHFVTDRQRTQLESPVHNYHFVTDRQRANQRVQCTIIILLQIGSEPTREYSAQLSFCYRQVESQLESPVHNYHFVTDRQRANQRVQYTIIILLQIGREPTRESSTQLSFCYRQVESQLESPVHNYHFVTDRQRANQRVQYTIIILLQIGREPTRESSTQLSFCYRQVESQLESPVHNYHLVTDRQRANQRVQYTIIILLQIGREPTRESSTIIILLQIGRDPTRESSTQLSFCHRQVESQLESPVHNYHFVTDRQRANQRVQCTIIILLQIGREPTRESSTQLSFCYRQVESQLESPVIILLQIGREPTRELHNYHFVTDRQRANQRVQYTIIILLQIGREPTRESSAQLSFCYRQVESQLESPVHNYHFVTDRQRANQRVQCTIIILLQIGREPTRESSTYHFVTDSREPTREYSAQLSFCYRQVETQLESPVHNYHFVTDRQRANQRVQYTIIILLQIGREPTRESSAQLSFCYRQVESQLESPVHNYHFVTDRQRANQRVQSTIIILLQIGREPTRESSTQLSFCYRQVESQLESPVHNYHFVTDRQRANQRVQYTIIILLQIGREPTRESSAQLSFCYRQVESQLESPVHNYHFVTDWQRVQPIIILLDSSREPNRESSTQLSFCYRQVESQLESPVHNYHFVTDRQRANQRVQYTIIILLQIGRDPTRESSTQLITDRQRAILLQIGANQRANQRVQRVQYNYHFVTDRQRANQRVQYTIIILLQIGREPTRESSAQLSFCYRQVESQLESTVHNYHFVTDRQRANQRVQYTIIILLQIGREPTRESSAQLSFCYRQVESQLESPVHNYHFVTDRQRTNQRVQCTIIILLQIGREPTSYRQVESQRVQCTIIILLQIGREPTRESSTQLSFCYRQVESQLESPAHNYHFVTDWQRANQRVQCTIIILLQRGREPTRESSAQLSFCYRQVESQLESPVHNYHFVTDRQRANQRVQYYHFVTDRQRANQRVQYTIIILLQIGREPTRESSTQLSFCYRQVESQLESPVHNYHFVTDRQRANQRVQYTIIILLQIGREPTRESSAQLSFCYRQRANQRVQYTIIILLQRGREPTRESSAQLSFCYRQVESQLESPVLIILLQIGREPTRESSTQLSFCYRQVESQLESPVHNYHFVTDRQRANQRVQYTIIILLQIGREPTRESSTQLSFCYRQVESQLESPVHNYHFVTDRQRANQRVQCTIIILLQRGREPTRESSAQLSFCYRQVESQLESPVHNYHFVTDRQRANQLESRESSAQLSFCYRQVESQLESPVHNYHFVTDRQRAN